METYTGTRQKGGDVLPTLYLEGVWVGLAAENEGLMDPIFQWMDIRLPDSQIALMVSGTAIAETIEDEKHICLLVLENMVSSPTPRHVGCYAPASA